MTPGCSLVVVAGHPRRRAVNEWFGEGRCCDDDVVIDMLQLEPRWRTTTSCRSLCRHRASHEPPAGAIPDWSAGSQHQLAAVNDAGRRLTIYRDELDVMAGDLTGRRHDVMRTHRRVQTVRLKPGTGNRDVEPQLVEDLRLWLRSEMAAERTMDVTVDRL